MAVLREDSTLLRASTPSSGPIGYFRPAAFPGDEPSFTERARRSPNIPGMGPEAGVELAPYSGAGSTRRGRPICLTQYSDALAACPLGL